MKTNSSSIMTCFYAVKSSDDLELSLTSCLSSGKESIKLVAVISIFEML